MCRRSLGGAASPITLMASLPLLLLALSVRAPAVLVFLVGFLVVVIAVLVIYARVGGRNRGSLLVPSGAQLAHFPPAKRTLWCPERGWIREPNTLET